MMPSAPQLLPTPTQQHCCFGVPIAILVLLVWTEQGGLGYQHSRDILVAVLGVLSGVAILQQLHNMHPRGGRTMVQE